MTNRSTTELSPDERELRELLSEYSLDDLARVFFVLNLWLPNVGSPIRIEYLYAVLEHLSPILPAESKIESYSGFEDFCGTLFRILPTFSMLEDYLPECDWGEIKYYFRDNCYSIFYGGGLSNPYDFYGAFEIMHLGFDEDYLKLLGHSPARDLEFCLGFQNEILTHLHQPAFSQQTVEPGHLEIPSADFWREANGFLVDFVPERLSGKEVLDRYTFVPGEAGTSRWPDYETFCCNARNNKNCFYLLIRSEGHYYPVMPRKCLGVLYDTWGKVLEDSFASIERTKQGAKGVVDIELLKYIRLRVDADSVYGLVTAMESKSQPHEMTFTAAIHADDTLYLIHVMPLSNCLTDAEGYLKTLTPKLKAAEKCLTREPTRLGVWSESTIVEFRPKTKENRLTPRFLVLIPDPRTANRAYRVPRDLPAILLPMDQFLGVLDEVEEVSELARFDDYAENLRTTARLSVYNSYLDLFGSFKDSDGVLVGGAGNPDAITLDPHWGTWYRYKSVRAFWRVFPGIGFRGHPRSWILPADGPPKTMKSKCFRAYALFESIGSASFFLHTPSGLLTIGETKLSELVMLSIRDGLTIYGDLLAGLSFSQEAKRVQVLCVPASAVRRCDELNHLRRFLPVDTMWESAITLVGSSDASILFLFDDQKLGVVLLAVQDRAVQIDLLIALLERLHRQWPDGTILDVVAALAPERAKKVRFRLYDQDKEVSIPEFVAAILPGPTEYKLADKDIAHLANRTRIVPRDYAGREAEDILRLLIEGLVRMINDTVSQFDFATAVPVLIAGVEALMHSHESSRTQVEESLNQEVDYDRGVLRSETATRFLHDHRCYRYLIEKYVQVSPTGTQTLTAPKLRLQLALVERLLNLYGASDAIHYIGFPVRLYVNSEFIADVLYDECVQRRQAEYRIEGARTELGLVGNEDDLPTPHEAAETYLPRLDTAFEADLGFGIKSMVSVLRVLSLWAAYYEVREAALYSATRDEIIQVSTKNIVNMDAETVVDILEFLTLRQDEVTKIVGGSTSSEPADLPVWEYAKRKTRYTVKPLIEIGGVYFWGPYSVRGAEEIWLAVAFNHKLPLPLDAPKTRPVLRKAHDRMSSLLERKIEEIVSRYTSHLRRNVFPHKLGTTSENIGDCDVLAYIEAAGVVLNIESKLIDPAFCLKDARRIAEKIYGVGRLAGGNCDGYLHKVERRHNHLCSDLVEVCERLGWPAASCSAAVVSVFVTQTRFWWTRFPLVDTTVHFVECRSLAGFIEGLVPDGTVVE